MAKIIKYIEELGKSQHNFVYSDKKLTALSGGWKSGKTFAHARKAVRCLQLTGQKGLVAEPSYRMNEDLLRPEYERYFNLIGLPFTWASSKSKYITPLGEILFRTLDKRDTLEGHNIGWFGLDEIDLLDYNKAQEDWRVLISKLTLGEVQYGYCTGTNEGYEFIYNEFVKGAKNVGNKYIKDNAELICVSTLENKHNLPDDYFETMRKQLDAKMWERYMEGKFVNVTSGRVYYNYSQENHIDRVYNPAFDTYLCWDFNINPLSCIIVQNDNGIDYAVNEFVFPSNTESMCYKIDDWFNQLGHPKSLALRGDATGLARKTSASASTSDWTIIEDVFKNYPNYESYVYGIKRCYSQKNRVAATNARFMDAKGNIKLYVNPNTCPKLDHDLNIVCWKEGGAQIDKKLGVSDPSDAFSYKLYKDYPIIPESKAEYA